MTHKSHVVFIVPDGVGIKNYLYSDLLKHISDDAKITIWSPLPESAFNEVKSLYSSTNIQYRSLKIFKESIVTRLLREASTYARLQYFRRETNNETLLLNWRKPKGNLKSKLLYHTAELLGNWAMAQYSRILKLESISRNSWKSKNITHYKTVLKDLNADTLFITHQRVAGLMPICLAAQELNIQTISSIFSWDNLPKARLCVTTDFYALWSDWMKRDMQLFYPEINLAKLKVVGTPQFEFYKQKNRIEKRKTFANQYNLNPNSKWICFSGDDELTSPYDPNYLEDIAKATLKNKEEIQIIFRRCPVDFSKRYDLVLNKYKDVIVSIDPVWNTKSKSWISYFSKLEDIDLQVNLVFHCEGVINLGSTMALDFATLDKPCFYLNYDTVKDENWSTNFIYKYHHFGSLVDLNPVGWINKKQDIENAISTIINDSDNFQYDRKKWLERLVLSPIEDNAEKLSKILI